jgi:hypothetical protein
VLQPESLADLGARGTADAGSTPPLADLPPQQEGVLEIEVFVGEPPVPGASVRGMDGMKRQDTPHVVVQQHSMHSLPLRGLPLPWLSATHSTPLKEDPMKKKSWSSFVVSMACLTLATTGCGPVDEEGEPSLSSAQSELSSAYMGCYVDTNALDDFTPNRCHAAGNRPTVAVFRYFTQMPYDFIFWRGHPECRGVECAVTISPGQRITLDVAYRSYQGVAYLGEAASATAGYLPGY